MSSKKEIERREKITSTSQSSSPDLNITTEPTINTRTTTEVPLHEQQREQHHAINRALDETKENIRKSTEEARNEIPRYTQAVNEYQEQTIQASREIADNYIESQKQIINSLQSALVPQIEKANRMFTSNWMSPRHLTEIYANMVSSFADNMIAATRLVNNMMFASMDAFKTSVQQSKDNAKELSRIGVNNARTFEQTSRDSAARLGRDDPRTSTEVYVEREQEEQGQRRY
jgi:predicted component of type VI protein secretion system